MSRRRAQQGMPRGVPVPTPAERATYRGHDVSVTLRTADGSALIRLDGVALRVRATELVPRTGDSAEPR